MKKSELQEMLDTLSCYLDSFGVPTWSINPEHEYTINERIDLLLQDQRVACADAWVSECYEDNKCTVEGIFLYEAILNAKIGN